MVTPEAPTKTRAATLSLISRLVIALNAAQNSQLVELGKGRANERSRRNPHEAVNFSGPKVQEPGPETAGGYRSASTLPLDQSFAEQARTSKRAHRHGNADVVWRLVELGLRAKS